MYHAIVALKLLVLLIGHLVLEQQTERQPDKTSVTLTNRQHKNDHV